MKKILMLGGSEAQLISIKKAKELGLYTIVCDYLPDNPGQYIADKFYLISTTDKDAILQVAIDEDIDGILAYSSDPAAPIASFVANKLGLPGLDYNMVRQFCEKQLFREFLQNNGFNVPKSVRISIPYDPTEIDISQLTYPVIVKPTDSSGSKGVTVINDKTELLKALKYGESYSRNKILIVEEFIERDHPHVIEAEIFVHNGEVITWGLINSIRDNNTNPLLPAGYTYPLELPEHRINIVKQEIKRLINAAGFQSGAFNIEMIINKNDKLFFLDAGPRNGGNRLPEFISMISKKDIVGVTINNAMGINSEPDATLDGKSGGYWGMAVLHSSQEGKFKQVKYSSEAKESLIIEDIQKNIGDKVNPFRTCTDLVGLTFHHFETHEKMNKVMLNMNKSIQIELS